MYIHVHVHTQLGRCVYLCSLMRAFLLCTQNGIGHGPQRERGGGGGRGGGEGGGREGEEEGEGEGEGEGGGEGREG